MYRKLMRNLRLQRVPSRMVTQRAEAYPILVIPNNPFRQDDRRWDADRCEHPDIPGFDVGQLVRELCDGPLGKWVPELQVLRFARDVSAAAYCCEGERAETHRYGFRASTSI